jgi:hypothetical protein
MLSRSNAQRFFFFEKKKQKTFAHFRVVSLAALAPAS